MCIQNSLQQHILDITNDGKDIANFLYATMHGQNPNAKFHHQMEAAKHLTKLALHTTPSPSTGEGWHGGENHQTADNAEPQDENPVHPVKSAPVTDLDIINYKVARLIREETNDGYLIAEFLSRVMHGTAGQGRPISEADRLRAATELMNRGLGRFGDTRDRRISNTQEDRELINSGLARYIRESTDHGLEPARFLLDVASGQDEGFTMHQRVTATRELIRRGWDTNCDKITPEDIAAYYERQEAREPTGYDNRLQEWREKEQQKQPVGATGRSPEDEPQLEAGLFAHLSFDEIDRYEAMSAEEQAEFVEKQRQYRATRKSAGHMAYDPLSPREKAGVRAKAPSPLTGEGWDGGENPAHGQPAEGSAASSIHPERVEGIDEGNAQQNTPSSSTGEDHDGSEDRIDTPSPLTGEGRDGGDLPVRGEPVEPPVEGPAQQDSPSPSTGKELAPSESRGRDGGEDPENINWNTLPQDASVPTSTTHPSHPVHPVSPRPSSPDT